MKPLPLHIKFNSTKMVIRARGIVGVSKTGYSFAKTGEAWSKVKTVAPKSPTGDRKCRTAFPVSRLALIIKNNLFHILKNRLQMDNIEKHLHFLYRR